VSETVVVDPFEPSLPENINKLTAQRPLDTLSRDTPVRRRGPSLSRRTGQNGNVYQPHAKSKKWEPKTPAYGRYWTDTPEGRKQRTVALGLCATRSIARQHMREYLERCGINSPKNFLANTSPAVTFRQRAELWLESMRTRKRKPVKAATLSGWNDALRAWLLPHLGDLPLSEVTNKTARELVEKMTVAELAQKTIVNYFQVVQKVVASAVDEQGDQIYPRNWNRDFIGLPIIQREKQSRPTITQAELETTLANTKPQKYRVLFTLLPAAGLRIGEALGLRTTDLSPDCRVIHVRQSAWRGNIQEPKTLSAFRVIDVPEVFAKMLREYIADKNGFLFASRQGKPLRTENIRRVLRKAAGRTIGFHVFRRYRAAVLVRAQAPDALIKLWLGHAQSLTDRYALQLRDDVAYRQEWAERVGLGFVCDTCDTRNVATSDARRAA
jgi:integrase